MKNIIKKYNIKAADELPLLSFDELLEKKESEELVEGWVITLEDGQMLKIKTDWYFHMHGLISSDALRENLLIESILAETIDDVLAQIGPCFKFDFITEVQEKVNRIFNNMIHAFLKLRQLYYEKYNEDRKAFAIKYKDKMIFPLVMKSLGTPDSEINDKARELVKNFILKKTNKLHRAQEFLNVC